jgi:AraC-like DNA-binding protein
MLMASSCWDKSASSAAKILMQPILFNDLQVTFIEVIGAYHDNDWVSTYHRHPWYEFNYISHGAVYTKMEDIEFLAQAGSFFLIPPGVSHSHRHCDYTGDDGFCIRWRLEKIDPPESICPQKMADHIIAVLSNYQLRSIEYAADCLFSGIEDASVYELEAIFIKWLMNICRAVKPDVFIAADRWEDNGQKNVVKQVLMYLDAYSSLDIDVNELADSVGYSYRHLARLFKEKTGSTIIEKLNSIRIAKAICLLENTDMTIGAICSEVGFNTETYFSTVFSEYTHLPPSQFRLKHHKS